MDAGFIFIFCSTIIVITICLVLVPIIAKIKSELDGNKGPLYGRNNQKAKGYNREVDAIHITTDASSERTRRLDQLKSLYESGMMEREEYIERCSAVEEDFKTGYRR